MPQEDTILAGKAAGREIGELQVVRLMRGRKSLDLWNALCLPRGGPDAPLLLLPDEYELLDPTGAPDVLAELLQVPPAPANRSCACLVRHCQCHAFLDGQTVHYQGMNANGASGYM